LSESLLSLHVILGRRSIKPINRRAVLQQSAKEMKKMMLQTRWCLGKDKSWKQYQLRRSSKIGVLDVLLLKYFIRAFHTWSLQTLGYLASHFTLLIIYLSFTINPGLKG